jgi:hypothetical protein
MAFIAVPALLVIGLTGALMGGERRRTTALALVGVLMCLAAFGAFAGWVMAYDSGRCDEACYPERGWQGTMDAWQWDAMFWVPFGGAIALCAAQLLIIRRDYRPALLPLAVATIAFAIYAALWAPHTSDY